MAYLTKSAEEFEVNRKAWNSLFFLGGEHAWRMRVKTLFAGEDISKL